MMPDIEIPFQQSRVLKHRKKSFIILSAALAMVAVIFVYEVAIPHSSFIQPREVAIAKGMGSRIIGALLRDQGIIRSKWVFVTYVSLRGTASFLKPGIYTFERDSIVRIADMLVAGGQHEKEITIPEGLTIRDIADYLTRQGIGTTAVLAGLSSPASAQTWAKQFDFLASLPNDAGLEGFLFPDTYRLNEMATPQDAIIKMLENFDWRVDAQLRQEIAHQNKTLFQIIIAASLIEKEVVSDEDRAIVSGVLWKRLAVGIRLQVDATIAYAKRQATGDKRQSVQKISLEDTKINSPYNTYRHRGLPPGPIANPGLSAIRAAIYPKSSPYLYYLSASDGRTIFSRTLDEHNAAKEKYLR